MTSEVEDLVEASDYYREVILTYRLIFGQDKPSYSDFPSLVRHSPIPEEYPDSLLSTLCGADWESSEARKVYDLIGADHSSTQYIPSTHFPFLGQRLLELQRYVKGRNANDILSIWHDRRSPTAWWTFWVCCLILKRP
jgi:hypothetical protein